MQKLLPFISFLYFFTLGFSSTYLLSKDISLTTIMQIFSILIFLIFLSTKYVFPRIKKPARSLAIHFALLPIVLFIYFLIFTTNYIFSPFIILTHFFAIALAFLISPNFAVSYITSTLLLLIIFMFRVDALFPLITTSPHIAGLYFFSYIGLIPFSYILAREYKYKQELAEILEKQIATSQTQEQQLLTSIEEAVVVISPNLEILYANEKTKNLFNLKNITDKMRFYDVFNLKDKDGRDIFAYSLPFTQTLESKLPQFIPNIKLAGPAKKYIDIDLKIIPAFAKEGPLGLILVIINKTSHNIAIGKQILEENLALNYFVNLLNSQKTAIEKIPKVGENISLLQNLSVQNEELSHLAHDFIYILKLDSGNIGALNSIVDVSEIVEKILSEKGKIEKINNVIISPVEDYNQTIQPVSFERNLKKRLFPKTTILGNEDLLTDAITRLLELTARISIPNALITVKVKNEQGVAIIYISSSKSIISTNEAQLLFEKFYSTLSKIPQLAQASGLEGYIASKLITQMGGSIQIDGAKDGKSLNFAVKFGIK